jgi:hypothetical protein
MKKQKSDKQFKLNKLRNRYRHLNKKKGKSNSQCLGNDALESSDGLLQRDEAGDAGPSV